MSNKFESNDDFTSNVQQQAESEVQQAVEEASTVLKVEQDRTQRLESQNQVEHASSSCRITRPLPGAFEVVLRIKAMFSRIAWRVKHGIGGLPSFFLARLIRFALRRPTLKAWALALLFRYPALEAWLLKFAVARGLIFKTVQLPYEPSTELSRLTPSARSIYSDLKAAIKRHNEEGR